MGCLPGKDLRPAGLLGVPSWQRGRHMLCIPRQRRGEDIVRFRVATETGATGGMIVCEV